MMGEPLSKGETVPMTPEEHLAQLRILYDRLMQERREASDFGLTEQAEALAQQAEEVKKTIEQYELALSEH